MAHSAHVEVKVDNRRYVEVLPLQRGAERDLNVTTIAENQRRARIELAVRDERGAVSRQPLTEVELRNLPAGLGRRPRITLRSQISDRGIALFTVSVEGREVASRRVRVTRWLPTRPVVWILPLAVLVLALLGWLGFRLASGAPLLPFAGAAAVQTSVPAPSEGADPGDGERADTADPDTAEADNAGSGPAAGAEAPGADTAGADAAAADAADAADADADDGSEEPAVAAVTEEWTVYFLPDDPRLLPAAQSVLDDALERVDALLEGSEAGIRRIEIVGHTALAGTESGRFELSRERARNVWSYLRAQGLPPAEERLIEGVAGQDPVTRDPEEQQLNRRVELTVDVLSRE